MKQKVYVITRESSMDDPAVRVLNVYESYDAATKELFRLKDIEIGAFISMGFDKQEVSVDGRNVWTETDHVSFILAERIIQIEGVK